MAPKIRLSEALDQYLAHRARRFSASTVNADTYILRRFQAEVGDLYVTSLTPLHVDDWMAGLLVPHTCRNGIDRDPISPSSFNMMRARLKAFFLWLTQRGMTRADLLSMTQPMKTTKRERLRVAPDVIWRMLDSASSLRDRTILVVAVNTALRANEIADLRLSDVDLATGDLKVRITKTGHEDTMPITSDLDAALREWLDYYTAWQVRDLGRVPQPGDYLFPANLGPRYVYKVAEDGTKVRESKHQGWDPLRPVRNLHLIAQAALRSVGLPTKHEGIHTLRRSVARVLYDSLLEEGHESAIRVTMTWLHHTNVSTTERYLGVTGERRTRDLHLRGRSLLGARPGDAEVVSIRR